MWASRQCVSCSRLRHLIGLHSKTCVKAPGTCMLGMMCDKHKFASYLERTRIKSVVSRKAPGAITKAENDRAELLLQHAHAMQCTLNDGCNVANCSYIRQVLGHRPIDCPLKLTGGCVWCKRHCKLIAEHASICLILRCPMENCDKVKFKLYLDMEAKRWKMRSNSM